MRKDTAKYIYDKLLYYTSKYFVLFSILFVTTGFLLQHIGLILPSRLLNAPGNAWNLIGIMESWLHVSYLEVGFIRRAAIGTILSPFSKNTTRVIYFFVSILCVFYLIYVFRHNIHDNIFPKKIGLIMILSPAGFLNIGWNFGRFDFVNFVILYAALLGVKRRSYITSSLLSVVAICIHEAFIFYGIPIIFASIISRSESNTIKNLGSFILLPTLITAYLFLYGSSNEVNALASSRPLIQYQGFDWVSYSVSIYYVIFSSLMYVNFVRKKLDILSISPFATFSLFLLGVDYMRWVTLFIISCFMSIFMMDESKKELDYRIGLPTIALVIMLPLGPLGVVKPFPAFEDFLMLIQKVI